MQIMQRIWLRIGGDIQSFYHVIIRHRVQT